MKAVRADEGQVVALVGVLIGVILLGLGLAVDVGQLFSARRAAQVAADAAAWGGAVSLARGESASQALAAACADAARNGFGAECGSGGPTVVVASPPASGTFAGDASYVEVAITQRVATTFFRALAPLSTVSVRAVAGVRNCGGTDYGVLLLNSGSSQLDMNNQSNIDLVVNGAGVRTNSSSSSSVVFGTSGSVTAASFSMVNDASGTNKSKISPPPLTDQTPADADPLLCVPRPSTAGMATYSGVDISGAAQSRTVSPGIYTNGFRVRGGATLTLDPGIYILKGGQGLNVSGSGSSIVAPSGGVLLYNTNANYPASGGGCGAVVMAGSGAAAVNLAAQRTGPYAGLVLWDDRVCDPNQSMTITSNWNLRGTVYFPSPGNRLTITQAASAALEAQLIVDQLTITQNFTLTLDYDRTKVYGRFPALVE